MTAYETTDTPGIRTDNAILILAREIGRLADAIDHHAVASQALRVPSGAPGAPVSASGPPGPPGGVSAKPEKTVQQKRGGLIYYACKNNGFDDRCGEIGQRIFERPMNNDARLWNDADQIAALETLKSWGWVEDKR